MMPKNPCNFFRQIEESLWKCSFCGETTTENPFGKEDPNWREKLKPGWKVYSDPTLDPKEPFMRYDGGSKLDVGLIYVPFIPEK